MRRIILTATAAFALAGVSPAAAQSLDDPEAVVVEELVVEAKAPGPAWWRVSDADSTVYILGVPGALPKGLNWDQGLLKRRLEGASKLIVQPAMTVGLGDVGGVIALRKQLKSDIPLSQITPAPLAVRMAAVAGRIGVKPDAYDKWKPLGAGLELARDFRRSAGLVHPRLTKTFARPPSRPRFRSCARRRSRPCPSPARR